MPQLVILPCRVGEECLVRADLNNRTMVKHGYLIAEAAGGEPVADINRCSVRHHLAESRIDFRFGNGVESRRRLVENDKRSILIQRTGNGDLLRFTARNIHAVFIEVLIKICVKPLRHFFGVEDKARFFKAGIDFSRIVA